jgi:hypothetical protein
MADLVAKLASQVGSRIRELGFDEPSPRMVGDLLELAYLGTLRSEEGQFVRGSLTFADPKLPDVDPPMLRRADYPAYSKFGLPERLTVQSLVKLARAIDRWSGVYRGLCNTPQRDRRVGCGRSASPTKRTVASRIG